MNPATHRNFIEMQVDDPLIQMLLPADDWFDLISDIYSLRRFRYYTNHSTKFGHFVKYHAARILIYIGLGDRVGNRVNLFQGNGTEMALIDRLHCQDSSSECAARRSLSGNNHTPAATTSTATAGGAMNAANSASEDEYIFETLRTATVAQEFSRTAMSLEGVLLRILKELHREPSGGIGNGTQESIREET